MTHEREENDIANRLRIGHEHHQAIDTHTHSARGRHTDAQTLNEIMIKRTERAFFVIGTSKLLRELGKLNIGIVEFRIRRSDFHTGDEQVPAFRNLRVRAVWARQRTDGTWIVKHESWSRGINERLGLLLKEMIDE